VDCVADANPLALRLEGSDRGSPFFFPRQKWTRRKGGRSFSHFSFSFHFYYSGFGWGNIVIWTPLAKEETRILSQHSDRVVSLSFSPDGRFLASTDFDRNLIIWSAEVNKKTERIKRQRL
jgi:WD40 repeat protein